MQENDFEKKLQLKMDQLALVPDEGVWKNVALRIRKEKRRKRFFIFLLSFTLLAGTGALYLYHRSNSQSPPIARAASTLGSSPEGKRSITPGSKQASTTSASSATRITEQSSIAVIKKAAPVATNLSSPKLQGSFSIPPVGPTRNKKRVFNAGKKGDKRSRSPYVSATIRRGGLQATVKTRTGSNGLLQNISAGARKELATLQPGGNQGDPGITIITIEPKNVKGKPGIPGSSKDVQQPLPTASPTSAGNQPEINTKKPEKRGPERGAALPDSIISLPSINKAAKKPIVAVSKGWKFGASVFAGMSNNLSGLHLLSSPPAVDQNNTPGLGNAAAGNARISKLKYTSGFSYGFGLYFRKQVSMRTWVSAGGNYLYASAVSIAGDPVNTRQTFFDANLQYSATVPAYYLPGKSVRYTNRYHLFEAPFQLLWQVNRRQDKAVLVTAGVVPSYLVAGDALYANLNQNVYYADNAQFRKWQVAIQAGVEFPLMIQKQFQLSAGPQLQYGLNNMGKTASGTSQHLFTAGLKFSLTLY